MRLLIKLPRTTEVEGRNVVLSDFEKHLVDESKDFHTKYGILTSTDLKKPAGSVVNAGKESFFVLDSSWIDSYKNIRRDAQIILLKDLGAILAETGVTKESVVAEAGTGSGAAACFFAEHAKQVYSFDIDKKNISTGAENAKSLGLSNISFQEFDIYSAKKLPEINADLFLLDVPDASKGVKNALKMLKPGGFLVIYVPHLHQAQNAVAALPDGVLVEKIIDVQHREWLVDEKRSRPATRDVAHTAFLVIVRKLQ
jgi:tRNA (adenine57-N1/adenine58-N1)-methyltransferase